MLADNMPLLLGASVDAVNAAASCEVTSVDAVKEYLPWHLRVLFYRGYSLPLVSSGMRTTLRTVHTSHALDLRAARLEAALSKYARVLPSLYDALPAATSPLDANMKRE